MDDLPRDPYSHAGAWRLCPACEMPEIPGSGCLCADDETAGLCCSTCGCSPGDYEASCPECRLMGRVDMSLASFLDRVLEPRRPHRVPPDELRAEEPLPTARPRSWWPVAS